MRRSATIAAVVLGLGACASTPTATSPTTASTPATALPPGALAAGPEYRVELEPLAPCAAGTSCEAKLVVHALGGFHVNAEYPTKFVVEPALGGLLDGPPRFATEEPHAVGTMTIKLVPPAAGTTRVAGTFKLGLCTGDICKIEALPIAFDVPAT